jgi:hypothetical protein
MAGEVDEKKKKKSSNSAPNDTGNYYKAYWIVIKGPTIMFRACLSNF